MSGCGRYERRISAYWDGELDTERCLELHRHVAGCSSCHEKFSRMERLHDSLKSSFSSSVEPMDELPDLVMAAVSREPYRPAKRVVSFHIPSLTTGWIPRAGWATAALAGITAFTLGLKPWSDTSDVPLDSRTEIASAPSPTLPETRTESPAIPAAPSSSISSNPLPRSVESPAKPAPDQALRPILRKRTPQRTSPALPARSESAEAAPRLPMKPAAVPTPPAVKAKNLAVDVIRLAKKAPVNVPSVKQRSPKPNSSPSQTPEASAGGMQLASANASARLQQVAGIAETRLDEQIDWTRIPLDTPVRMDQRVRSGDDSRIALALGNGLELRMNEDTEIVPLRAPQGDSPYWVISLVKGEVFARVPKGGSGIKIMTAENVAFAREGELIVRTNELLETRLVVAKGKATLENIYGRSTGSEGSQVSSRMGLAPDPALPALDLDASFRWAYAPIVSNERILHRPG